MAIPIAGWIDPYGECPDMGLGYPTWGMPSSCQNGDGSCPKEHAPEVSPSGNVRQDPEILLTAQKFGLATRFTYNSSATDNAEYGYGRSASTHCRLYSSTSSNRVTITLGDFKEYGYSLVGTSGGSDDLHRSLRRRDFHSCV